MNLKPTRPTVGPRGGREVQATPCAECVSWRSCRPAAITEPWGCESWVDQSGHRALPDQLEDEGQDGYCAGCANEGSCNVILKDDAGIMEICGDRIELDGAAEYEHDRIEAEADLKRLSKSEPDPESFRPAAPYAPDQQRGEGPAQGILPMGDAGSLFAALDTEVIKG